MAQRKKARNNDAGPQTTGAGLARRMGVHRATVTRALRKVSGGEGTRVGHQFMLNKSMQEAVKNRIKRA